MKLALKNIAKVKYADVELKGITVIAGENNTGKSTVGKTLYSVFNSFYDLDEKIYEERVNSVGNIIDSFYYSYKRRFLLQNEHDISKNIVDKFINSNIELETLKSEFIAIVLSDEEPEAEFEEEIDNVVSRIEEIISISDIEVFKTVISNKLNIEFNNQVNNIFSESNGTIELTIKNNITSLEIKDNQVRKVENAYSLKKDIVYIDDPFVLDGVMSRMVPIMNSNYISHKQHLRKKLFVSNPKNNFIDEIITNNKLEKIYEKINTICGGEIVRKRGGFEYKREDKETNLSIKNLSTGLKTFVILKTLLQNGSIEYNGTIILDEPEIHLHPQWQIAFAEIIALIQKEFNMHILLNTHSPYFMKAIEVYAAKYEIADKCKYYLAHLDGDMATIDDVTDYPEKIYKLLAQPLQELENVLYAED